MNFIKSEEKLLKAQLELEKELKQSELLSKLDEASMKIESRIPERVPVTVKVEENLGIGDKFEMPLKIAGKMLGIGRHKARYYTEEELKKAVDFHQGKTFPLKLDHRKAEVASTIGAVDKIYWDDEEKCIKYEAHVNDATQARNVVDLVIGGVSAGILSIPTLSMSYGIIGKELEFTELSFVEEPAYKGNTLEAK